MANFRDLKIFLEFEPIVKLVCENTNCKNNLMMAANNVEGEMYACNLKQIIIGKDGHCQSFQPIKK